jgi:hypothetical protein
MMKRTALFLATLAIVSMFTNTAEACRRKHRGGGCGCGHMEVTDVANLESPASN